MKIIHSRLLLALSALLLALSALLLAACSQPKDKFIFEGKIAGIQQAEFYVYSDDGALSGVDTIRIDDGKFSYECQLTSPAVLTLLYPNFSQTYIVAEPGKTIEMKGDAAKLGEADISGSEENELLTDFRQKQNTLPENNQRLAASEFIRTHTKTLAAVAVFKKYFAYAQAPDAATTRSLLKDLTKAQPRNAALTLMAERLLAQLNGAAGQTLPDFSFETLAGKPVNKAQFSGRPFVVFFTASWAGNSRLIAESLRRMHNAYGNRVGAVVLSMDLDRNGCKQQMERDSISAPVICDGKAFQSKAAQTLGLRYVPGNLLVNAEGRVVARDLDFDEIEKRLAELMK